MIPRGLIVDFGGVLTTSIGDSFRAFCEREGVSPDRLDALFEASYREVDDGSLVALVERGTIPTEEFERRLAEVFSANGSSPIRPDGLVDRMLGGVEPEPAMLAAVRHLRDAGVPTALLSNAWSRRQYRLAGIHPGELFDALVVSVEVGMRKPEAGIYRLAAERLRLAPEACVFVDDIEENVEASRGVGMRGVVHEDPGATIAELERMFETTIPVED